MKILFLDIDGVLNTDRQIRKNSLEQNENIQFDPYAMQNLKRIIDETKAKIVVTSTWRIHRENNGYLWKELIRNFEEFDLNEKNILDITPVMDTAMKPEMREKEILKWLGEHEGVENFIILDDQWDMGTLNGHFIRCFPFNGITEKTANETISIL